MSGFMGLDNSMMAGEMERGGELRRYMFAVELNGTIGTKTEKGSETVGTFTWTPDEAASMYRKIPSGNEEYDAIRQTLVIRRVILGPSAKEGESNWVNVEVNDPEGSDTKFPLAHLSKGKESQTVVDLAFPDARDVNVKFTLAEGTGPVHIIGYHLIERIQFDNQEECEEDEDVEEEDQDEREISATGAKVIKAPIMRVAKRRMNLIEVGNGDDSAKKVKTVDEDEGMEDGENGTGNGNAKN